MPAPETSAEDHAESSGWSYLAFDLTGVALALAWLVGTGLLVLAGIGEVLTFFGESPTAEEEAASRRLLGAAAVVALAVPVVGLGLCLWLHRKRLGILFAVLLLVGSALAGLVGLDAYRTRPAEPVEIGPWVCQEHSGGDNRCPGG